LGAQMFNAGALRLKQLALTDVSVLYSVSTEIDQDSPRTPPKLRSRCDTGSADTLH